MPVVAAIVNALILIGTPLVILSLDKGKTPEDVPGGTACILALGGSWIATFAFAVAGIPMMPPLVKSFIMTVLCIMVMTVLKPATKRAYGANWVREPCVWRAQIRVRLTMHAPRAFRTGFRRAGHFPRT